MQRYISMAVKIILRNDSLETAFNLPRLSPLKSGGHLCLLNGGFRLRLFLNGGLSPSAGFREAGFRSGADLVFGAQRILYSLKKILNAVSILCGILWDSAFISLRVPVQPQNVVCFVVPVLMFLWYPFSLKTPHKSSDFH